MRDLRKIKSKYEFKLDNKQIAFLLVGTLVILVVVFALGVVVGKGLTQIQSIETAQQLQAEVETELATVPDVEPVPLPEAATPAAEDSYINLLETDVPQGDATPIPAGSDLAATPAPAPEATPPPPPPNQVPEGGKFTIQLSSHPSMEEAESHRATYASQGVTDVYIVSAQVKGEEWYRVRTGAFATKVAASKVADAIKAKGIVADPWVTAK